MSTDILVVHDPKGLRAREVVQQLDAALEQQWEAALRGESEAERHRYEAAVAAGRRLNIPPLTQQEIVGTSIEGFLTRMEHLLSATNLNNGAVVDAIFNKVTKPRTVGIKVSDLHTEITRIEEHHLAKMAEHQVKRWHTTRANVQREFIKVIGGDRDLATLTGEDTAKFRDYLSKKIVKKEMLVNTANKRLGEITGMFRAVNRNLKLNLEDVFRDLRFPKGENRQRDQFPLAMINDVLLADDFFQDLNADARRIVLVCIDTGLRPSEVTALDRKTIHLDGPIPYVDVTDRDDPMCKVRLKTKESQRKIPLVGCALAACHAQPEGFGAYFGRSNSLSALVNKYFRNHGIPRELTLYSLRHSFAQRLRDVAGAQERNVERLLGHSVPGEKYGDQELALRHQTLLKMASRVPALI
jgi:integrase